MGETSNEGLTCYNEWFISALKSSRFEGKLQEKKLLQNCLNCSNQVKTFIESKGESIQKYEEFRLNCTIILLLGCPSINTIPEISSSEDLIPLIKSIPAIEHNQLFLVLKGLKNYKYLRAILPWLPVNILTNLLGEFLDHFNAMTPLVLAISFEFFFGLIYSLQFELKKVIRETEYCLTKFIEFYKLNKFNDESEQDKRLKAYHFIYMVESLYLFFCILSKTQIEEPFTTSLGLQIKKLQINLDKEFSPELEPVIIKATHSLLSLCNDAVITITSNVWISWYTIKSPVFGLSISSDSENEPDNSINKSIQLQISHTMYKILKISKKIKSPEDSLDLSTYKELNTFFSHCSFDPDYDLDTDLTNSELLEALESGNERKNKKLITILLSREDTFTSEECLQCAKTYGKMLSKPFIVSLTNKFIDEILSGKEVMEGWKRVLLDLCRVLSAEDLTTIIKCKLNYGQLDCLKTPDFFSDLTQIFNQLSDPSNEECCLDTYMWLCVQSGVEVVKWSIDMALSLPGVAPVVSPALATIYFICLARNTDEDVCLITKLLTEKLASNLTSESKSECLALIQQLLATSELAGPRANGSLPLDVSETYRHIICPKLNWHTDLDADISFALEMLATVITWHPTIVLESESRFSSLVVSLCLIHHNCCSSSNSDFSISFSLRESVERIMGRIVDKMIGKEDDYSKEISLIKDSLHNYELNPRSLSLISPLVGPVPSDKKETSVDLILALLLKPDLNHKSLVSKCNRMEWIWALYMILPTCSEAQWSTSFHLTHLYLQNNVGEAQLVTPTLKIYHEVFVVACEGEAWGKKGGFAVLRHSFKAFAAAAMNFLNRKLESDEKQFDALANVFIWWCRAQRVFRCDPELPCLFLNNLCTSLVDLVKAGAVVLVAESKNVGADSNDVGKESVTSVQDQLHFKTEDDQSVDMNGDATSEMSYGDTIEENTGEYVSNTAKRKQKCETITKERMKTVLESMIRMFVVAVPSNKVASTIGGKLKILYENCI